MSVAGRHSNAERKKQWRLVKAAAAAGAIGGLVQVLLTPYRIDWDAVWRIFQPWWTQALGVGGALLGAFGLFYVHSRWPRIYAFIELVFAAISTWMAVGSQSASAMERGAKLAAGIYLFVRGLDNWDQAPKRIQEWEQKRALNE